MRFTPSIYRPVVQLVEHRSPKPGVGGSSPSWPAIFFNVFLRFQQLMSMKSEEKEYRLDPLKWLVVIALIVAGVVENSYFSAESILYRVIGLLVIALVACFIAYQTAKGASLWGLVQGAMVELRKVVWPSRQETNQTTLIVVAVVIVMSIILWLLDTVLGFAASSIIG